MLSGNGVKTQRRSYDGLHDPRRLTMLSGIPNYPFKREKVELKVVSVWTDGTIIDVNNCFHNTNWDVFTHALI